MYGFSFIIIVLYKKYQLSHTGWINKVYENISLAHVRARITRISKKRKMPAPLTPPHT